MAAEPTNKELLKQIVEAVSSAPQINFHSYMKRMDEFMIRQEAINEKVADNHEDINGNGKDGIKKIVNKLADDMSEIKKVTWVIAGAIITTIVTSATVYIISRIIGA